MGKGKFDYFDAFSMQAEYAKEAAEFLINTFDAYDLSELRSTLSEMHAIESKGDDLNREVKAHLRHDFVTPLERDDIAQFTLLLDDILDKTEDILMCMYMYHIDAVNDDMRAMARILNRATQSLAEAIRELPRFRKKSKDIVELLGAVNDAEEEGDRLFLEATHRLFAPDSSLASRDCFALAQVYQEFEDAIDACEITASRMDEIIMTNM